MKKQGIMLKRNLFRELRRDPYRKKTATRCGTNCSISNKSMKNYATNGLSWCVLLSVLCCISDCFNFMIRSLLWWFSLPIFTCTASSSTYTKCSSRFFRDGKAIPRDWFPSRGTRIPSHGKKFPSRGTGIPSRTGLLTFPRSVLYELYT